MKKSLLLLSTFCLLFFSCGDEIGSNVNCDEVGPPIFTSGPTVISGASSVDFVFRINQTAVLYLIIYTQDQGDLTPEEVKTKSTDNSNPFIVEDRRAVTLTCREVSDGDITITSENLTNNTTLYAYLVAESNSQDEILQDEVTKIELNMLNALPVESFQSVAENREVLYLEYTPESFIKYPDSELYPAIIFLGGNGETAAQGSINLIKNGTLPHFLDKQQGSIPFFVFSPQHIQNNWNEDMVNEMVEYAKANYPIDPDRVHMTGISGGGIGTWRYAINYPDQLASIIPISGSGNTGQACELINIATWAFHNDVDNTVATSGSINMINAINACNPGPTTTPQITLFEDDGHNAWRRVYNDEHPDWDLTNVSPIDIYPWLEDQTR